MKKEKEINKTDIFFIVLLIVSLSGLIFSSIMLLKIINTPLEMTSTLTSTQTCYKNDVKINCGDMYKEINQCRNETGCLVDVNTN